MNIPPSEADRLDLGTYEVVLDEWNEMHAQPGADVEPPDPEIAMAIIDKANMDPRLIH